MYINASGKQPTEILNEYNKLKRFNTDNQVIIDFQHDSVFTKWIPLIRKIKNNGVENIILKNIGHTCNPFKNFCIENKIFIQK